MTLLQSLAAEFVITVSNGAVWLAIGQGLLFAGVAMLFGTWVARRVGLLAPSAPAGETLGVGLACGLIVVAAGWAAIWSGGRSSFTPVAIGFAIAIAFALVRRRGPKAEGDALAGAPLESAGGALAGRWGRHRSLVLTTFAGGVFILAVGLLYGSTMAPSPRDGVQPLESNDEAYYSILGRDLAATGTETMYSSSGFTEIPGLPAQAWYHWGELWLASAAIAVLGTAPVAARYFVVLPVMLLAAAALTGTVVRRMTRTSSRRAYLFGFLACLLLAPVALLPGPFFSARTVGLIFGITAYVMPAVAVLLTLYALAVLGTRAPAWALAGFVGNAIAFILPAHLVIAALGLVGVGSVWAIRIGRSLLSTRRLPVVSLVWGRTLAATGVVLIATVAWGLLTSHGIGSSGGSSQSVSPFNGSWRGSVVIIALGAGALFAIPLAWFADRRFAPARAELYVGTMVILVVGAVVWGARLSDFNMFHVFFAGISVVAAPVAAVAVWVLWFRLRETRHLRLAAALVILCAIQLETGVFKGLIFLESLAPMDYPPIPSSLLSAIERLPVDARLAYACGQFEEVGFTGSQLLSIDAHTGRRVVPMCFEADRYGQLIGGARSLQVPNPFFEWAPQRTLYPDAMARPSSTAVATFLKENGIEYIYADAKHPNSLVPDAIPVAVSGDTEVLRIP